MEWNKFFDEIYIPRKKWEKRLNDFTLKDGSTSSLPNNLVNSAAQQKNSRFLFVGGIGGAGKSWLINSFKAHLVTGNDAVSEPDKKKLIIPIAIDIDDTIFHPNRSSITPSFEWHSLIDKLAHKIECAFDTNSDFYPYLQEKKLNKHKPNFYAYHALYDKGISCDDTGTRQQSHNKYIIRYIEVIILGIGLFIDVLGASGFASAASVISIFTLEKKKSFFLKMLSTHRDSERFTKIGAEPSSFPDASIYSKDSLVTDNKSLYKHQDVLLDAFKCDLNEYCKTHLGEIEFIFIFDINYLPGDESTRNEFMRFISALISNSKRDGQIREFEYYDESTSIILVSKQRNKLWAASIEDIEQITIGMSHPLDIRSLDDSESKHFVLETIRAWQKIHTQKGDIDGAIINEVKNLLINELEGENTQRALQDVEKIAKLLHTGLNGKIMRIPEAIRCRCQGYLDKFGNDTWDDIDRRLSEEQQTHSTDINRVKLVTNQLNEYEQKASERLFERIEGKDIVQRTVRLLACFGKLSDSEWNCLDCERIEQFNDFKERSTFAAVVISVSTETGIEETVTLHSHIRALITTGRDHLQWVREDLRNFFNNYLVTRLPIRGKTISLPDSYVLRNISLAFDCIHYPAYNKEFGAANSQWPADDTAEIIMWLHQKFINRSNYDDLSIKFELESLYKKAFEIALLFFARVPKEARDTEKRFLHNEEWRKLIDSFHTIINYYTHQINFRYLDVETRILLTDIQARLANKSMELNGRTTNSDSLIQNNIEVLRNIHKNIRNLHGRLGEWIPSSKHRPQTRQVIDNTYTYNSPQLVRDAHKAFNEKRKLAYAELEYEWLRIVNSEKEIRSMSLADFLELARLLRKLASTLIYQIRSRDTDENKEIESCTTIVILPFLNALSFNIPPADAFQVRGKISWYIARTLTYWLKDTQSAYIQLKDVPFYKEWYRHLKTVSECISYFTVKEITELFDTLDIIYDLDADFGNQLLLDIRSASSETQPWPECQKSSNALTMYLKKMQNSRYFPDVYIFFTNYLLNSVREVSKSTSNHNLVLRQQLRLLLCGVAYTRNVPDDITCKVKAREIRKQYVKCFIDHLKKRPRQKPLHYNQSKLKDEINNFCDLDWDKQNSLMQALFQIVAIFNPSIHEALTRDFVAAKITHLSKSEIQLEVPYSKLRIHLPMRLVPTKIYKSAQNAGTDAEYWIGRYILVNIFNITKDDTIIVTACGPEYIGKCFHLFYPTARDWEKTNPRSTQISPNDDGKIEWNGDLWLGGSNGWAVFRLPANDKASLLSNGGCIKEELTASLGLNQLTVFEKAEAGSYGDEREMEQQEIIQFTNDTFRELDVIFGENDEVLLVNNNAFHNDFFNRKHLSMFNKIFDLPVSIYGWSEQEAFKNRTIAVEDQ